MNESNSVRFVGSTKQYETVRSLLPVEQLTKSPIVSYRTRCLIFQFHFRIHKMSKLIHTLCTRLDARLRYYYFCIIVLSRCIVRAISPALSAHRYRVPIIRYNSIALIRHTHIFRRTQLYGKWEKQNEAKSKAKTSHVVTKMGDHNKSEANINVITENILFM